MTKKGKKEQISMIAAIKKGDKGHFQVIVYKQVEEQAKDFIAASAVYLAQELGNKVYIMYSAEGLYRMEDYE